MNTWIVLVMIFLGNHRIGYVDPTKEFHSQSECFVQGIPRVEEALRAEHPEIFAQDAVVVKYSCIEKPFATGLETTKPAQGGF